MVGSVPSTTTVRANDRELVLREVLQPLAREALGTLERCRVLVGVGVVALQVGIAPRRAARRVARRAGRHDRENDDERDENAAHTLAVDVGEGAAFSIQPLMTSNT